MSRKLGGQKLKHRIRQARQELRACGVLTTPGLAREARGDLKGALAELCRAVVIAHVRDASLFSGFVDWKSAPNTTTSPLAARKSGDA